MDWVELKSITEGQGLFFWLSAGAIAAGITLLVVSSAFQVRKLIRSGSLLRIGSRSTRAFSRPRANAAAPKCQISVTDTGYSADATAKFTNSSSLNANEASVARLSGLLKRLRTAGDQLEETRLALERRNDSAELSELKPKVPEVEYVFKAGVS